MTTILFSNPPFWQATPDGLRQGIRAGSRWPFTRPAAYAPDQFKFGSYLPFPFFLGSAAAYVAEHTKELDYEVIMRDSIARGESYQSFFAALEQIKPSAFVLETGAAAWEHDLNLLRYVRGQFPEIRIAVTGPTAANAAKTTPPGVVDAWLLGEYEKNGLAFAMGASGVLGFNLLTRDELKAVPFPMFDEPVALNYWDACPQGQQAPHLQLFASRGCPYHCCFCAWPGTMTGDDPDGTKPRSVRFYSPDWVERFIRERMAKAKALGTPLRSVYLDDDTANLSDRHMLEISAVMKRIGLPWSAMCRADTSKPETWKAMKDAGCYGVKIGFESGSQRVVDDIVGKKLDLRKAEATARWLRGTVGMTVHGTFTVGLPGETAAERQETLDFIRNLYATGGLDTHQLSGTAMIEGTPLEKIANGEELAAFPGAKKDGEFSVSHDGVMKLEGMTR